MLLGQLELALLDDVNEVRLASLFIDHLVSEEAPLLKRVLQLVKRCLSLVLEVGESAEEFVDFGLGLLLDLH